MGISRVEFGDDVLIDLTEDTVTASALVSGYTAHGADGEQIIGEFTETDPTVPQYVKNITEEDIERWNQDTSSADKVSYDNTNSNLEAENVQDAIDELQSVKTNKNELPLNEVDTDVSLTYSNALDSELNNIYVIGKSTQDENPSFDNIKQIHKVSSDSEITLNYDSVTLDYDLYGINDFSDVLDIDNKEFIKNFNTITIDNTNVQYDANENITVPISDAFASSSDKPYALCSCAEVVKYDNVGENQATIKLIDTVPNVFIDTSYFNQSTIINPSQSTKYPYKMLATDCTLELLSEASNSIALLYKNSDNSYTVAYVLYQNSYPGWSGFSVIDKRTYNNGSTSSSSSYVSATLKNGIYYGSIGWGNYNALVNMKCPYIDMNKILGYGGNYSIAQLRDKFINDYVFTGTSVELDNFPKTDKINHYLQTHPIQFVYQLANTESITLSDDYCEQYKDFVMESSNDNVFSFSNIDLQPRLVAGYYTDSISGVDALKQAENLYRHSYNMNVHVTEEEKEKWNSGVSEEVDPTVPSYVKNITQDEITKWNSNHLGIATDQEVFDVEFDNPYEVLDNKITTHTNNSSIHTPVSANPTISEDEQSLTSIMIGTEKFKIVGGSGSSSASQVSYDNTSSQLESTNVQSAIDELNSNKLILGESSSNAYYGDKGKVAYDHSQTTGNPHGTTKSDIGLGNVDNTSDLNKPISTETKNALDNMIKLSDTQPSSTYNKMWVEGDTEEVSLCTMNEFDALVKVSDTQPTSEYNKQWIEETTTEVTVTTKSDLERKTFYCGNATLEVSGNVCILQMNNVQMNASQKIIPEAYRPKIQVWSAISDETTGSRTQLDRVTVETDGTVVIQINDGNESAKVRGQIMWII